MSGGGAVGVSGGPGVGEALCTCVRVDGAVAVGGGAAVIAGEVAAVGVRTSFHSRGAAGARADDRSASAVNPIQNRPIASQLFPDPSP